MNTLVLISLLIASAFAAPQLDVVGRIVEGEDARPGQYPHVVSLQYSISAAYKEMHMCGGSIIDKYWILTAGHCLTELPTPGIINILGGTNDISNPNGAQKIKVIARHIHKDYQGGATPNDVALLKLEKPLEFNEFVQPITLAKMGEEPVGVAEFAGWGSVARNPFEPVVPEWLQRADLPFIDYNTCIKLMIQITGQSNIVRSQICSGILSVQPTTGVCVGDSGGPLVQKTKDGFKQFGIASWILAPCGSGTPSVFTSVPHFNEWIQKTIGK